MAIKFDPILKKVRSKDVIRQLSTDPSSPVYEESWVLRTVSGGSGGGTLKAVIGMGFPALTINTGGSSSYQLSYYTKEGTIERVTLS